MNQQYMDLSKMLKKVEDRVIKGVEDAVAKELQSMKESVKAVHRDVKDVRILMKNIDTSLASSNDEYTNLDEEDKSSEERAQDVPNSDKPS